MNIPDGSHPFRGGLPLGAKREFDDWLSSFIFARFVTLATNSSSLSTERARDLLKRWDCRLNSVVAGPRWHRRRDKRLFCFYFLEKPNRNPHWHCMIRFRHPEPAKAGDQMTRFDESAEQHWCKLVPSGTINIQPISCQKRARNYVTKGIFDKTCFEEFILPDQFS